MLELKSYPEDVINFNLKNETIVFFPLFYAFYNGCIVRRKAIRSITL